MAVKGLKPCPLCHSRELTEDYVLEDQPGDKTKKWYRGYIECECGITMAYYGLDVDDLREILREDWNTRLEDANSRTCEMNAIVDPYDRSVSLQCSRCDYVTEDQNPIFCPHCGAEVIWNEE